MFKGLSSHSPLHPVAVCRQTLCPGDLKTPPPLVVPHNGRTRTSHCGGRRAPLGWAPRPCVEPPLRGRPLPTRHQPSPRSLLPAEGEGPSPVNPPHPPAGPPCRRDGLSGLPRQRLTLPLSRRRQPLRPRARGARAPPPLPPAGTGAGAGGNGTPKKSPPFRPPCRLVPALPASSRTRLILCFTKTSGWVRSLGGPRTERGQARVCPPPRGREVLRGCGPGLWQGSLSRHPTFFQCTRSRSWAAARRAPQPARPTPPASGAGRACWAAPRPLPAAVP